MNKKKCYRWVKETHNVWQTGMGKVVIDNELYLTFCKVFIEITKLCT